MRLVLLGYNSFVGSALSEFYSTKSDVEIIYVGRKCSNKLNVVKFEVQNDIEQLQSDISSLIHDLHVNSDTILVNCVSMGDVDKCETNKEECRFQNLEFVKQLYLQLAKLNFRKLIHFSTNAVYDGENAPYNELSTCNPVNYYGKIKLTADKYLLEQNDSRVIVARPITMYGKVPPGGRPNPTSMIINQLSNGKHLKLVDDVLVNILYIGDLVRTIDKLVNVDFSGLINISSDEIYSRYDLGLKIAEIMGIDANLIESVTSSEFKTIAPRPLNTSFDNSLMKKFGIQPMPLSDVVQELL